MLAAVAAGAVTAASQGIDPLDGERTDGTAPLAFGSATGAFTGIGGSAPAAGVLPLPDVMPVQQQTVEQDVASLAKGRQIAADREAAERATAERAAAEKAREEAQQAAEQGASQLPVPAGSVVKPAAGELTSGFGSRWGSSHMGIDIANSIGTPIYSTTDGVVVEAGPASGFGMWVRVQHSDGTISVYGHINEAVVSEGQQVAAGEQIATMGNRGQSTGPHLHFEIWQDGGEKINPLSWLQDNGVDL